MFQRKAYTFTELLIVVIIIGLLAAIAVPTYQRTVESSFGKQAKAVLRAIHAAQRMHLSDTDTYNGALNGAGSLVALGYLKNPNIASAKFNYTIPVVNNAVSPRTFTAQATRNSGVNNTEFLTINQTGAINDAGWTP